MFNIQLTLTTHLFYLYRIQSKTPWAAFDGIEEYGFLMDTWSIDAISMGVAWSLTLDPVKIEEMSCNDSANTLSGFGESGIRLRMLR